MSGQESAESDASTDLVESSQVAGNEDALNWIAAAVAAGKPSSSLSQIKELDTQFSVAVPMSSDVLVYDKRADEAKHIVVEKREETKDNAAQNDVLSDNDDSADEETPAENESSGRKKGTAKKRPFMSNFGKL